MGKSFYITSPFYKNNNSLQFTKEQDEKRKELIHELESMTLWKGVLYFGTSCFNSALFAFLFFFTHVIRIFVISDGSSKSPSFHLPAVGKKFCL